MLQTVVAIERDGFDVRVLSIVFEVPSADFNLLKAVEAAAADYCRTQEGKKQYEYNCSSFNWADFEMSVPNEFCEKYGFKKVDSALSDIVVDWDEQLVDDSFLYEDDDEDGE